MPYDRNARRRERYAIEPGYKEKHSKRLKSYYDNNKEKVKQRLKSNYRKDPSKFHARRIETRFGLTATEYDSLLEKQGGCCAICGGQQVNGRKRLDVDHDHLTGTVRGLLCGYCNRAIGMMKDDPELLRRAASYLEVIGGLKALQQREMV